MAGGGGEMWRKRVDSLCSSWDGECEQDGVWEGPNGAAHRSRAAGCTDRRTIDQALSNDGSRSDGHSVEGGKEEVSMAACRWPWLLSAAAAVVASAPAARDAG